MRTFFFISLVFLIYASPIFGQNWKEVGNGMSFRVASFFTDTVEQVLYIGGHFIYADTVEVNGIVKWDGQKFYDLAGGDDWCGSFSCGPFLTIAKYKEEIYCNVLSPTIGGVPVSGIAKWNGTEWSSVGIIPIDGVIYSLEVYNEILYVMGTFKMIDQDTTYSITRWDGENWFPIVFADFPSDFQPSISCSAIFEEGYYFGGNFVAIINGEETRDIIRWDGENWYPVGGGMHGGSSNVNDIIIYKNELYIAGRFKKSDGNAGSGILKLQGDSLVDVGGSFDTPNVSVQDMVIYKGELYVLGSFDSVSGIEVSHIAKWDGSRWCSLGSEFNKALTAGGIYNNELYIGGAFEFIDGDTASYIAKWTGDNYVDTCGAIFSKVDPIINSSIIELYPNPTNNKLHISVNGSSQNQSVIISIYTIFGHQVMLYPEFDLGEEFDVSKLSSGTYILKLQNQEGINVRKFVVQH